MVGINALIYPNTINARVIQSMDIVGVSVMEGAEHRIKKNKITTRTYGPTWWVKVALL